MDTHELEWLRRVRDLSQQLGSETDLASLTPRILTAALELTGAQRALLVAVQPPEPGGHARISVLASEGFHREGLDGAGGAVPRAACERVLQESRGLTTSRSDDLQVLSAMTSVAELGARSLAAVPLRLRGETQGVLYLDHLEQEGLFREQDLPTLQTLATQAALSLELLSQAPTPEASPPAAQYLVGSSPPMQALADEIQRASRCREPVLVCGEAGTELGWVARELHARGADRLARFRLASAADPDIARQLLGEGDEPGWLATPTTVAISETESLPPEVQLALARAIAEGTVSAPGSARSHPLSARLVALTHTDLHASVQAGEFRPELFYRLDVLRLVVPPLRQRSEDIPTLCDAVIERLSLPALKFTPDAMARLTQYAWPGNLLELEGELRRLAQLGSPRPIDAADLSERVRAGRGVVASTSSFAGKTLSEIEETLVRQAMERCGGVKARAARQLGVPRSTLYHLLERYGIR